jgi:hypothetical protein
MDGQFDRQLSKRPLAFDDFEPGTDEQPEAATAELPRLRIESAILALTNHLRVTYSHRLESLPSSLRLTIRISGETRPRISTPLPRKANGTETIALAEAALADAHGTLLATLVADVGGKLIESFPVWVIQEHQLTYEPREGSSSSKGKIEETGEGLPEFLDELGKRDGLPAVIEYLRHLNIRFHDGGGSGVGHRKFRIKIRDPLQPDAALDWLIEDKETERDCEQAILEFVDRHQKRRFETREPRQYQWDGELSRHFHHAR